MPELTVRMTQARYDKFIIGYLRAKPIRTKDGEPVCTLVQWLRKNILKDLCEDARRGFSAKRDDESTDEIVLQEIIDNGWE